MKDLYRRPSWLGRRAGHTRSCRCADVAVRDLGRLCLTFIVPRRAHILLRWLRGQR
jgi:hypothetical protein